MKKWKMSQIDGFETKKAVPTLLDLADSTTLLQPALIGVIISIAHHLCAHMLTHKDTLVSGSREVDSV